ncbi:MAG TPA: hypothetical protein PLP29_10555 [Candidatus Ozemobacteraceae bacterium]|nr:hypothetical protein [Candidatus Ozemobacteraceae bacterium]
MPETPSQTFLESLVFCGLCFTQMKLEDGHFTCSAGCPSIAPVTTLEELVWKEVGNFLANPEGRKAATRHLDRKITAQDVRHLFRDMGQFSEFVPIEEKRLIAEALIEKVDVLSAKAIHIHFRF